MSNGQIVPFAKKVQDFRGALEQLKPQLAMALPTHVKADRILRILMTTVQRTPKLLDCTRETLFGAIMQASQLGLEPDGVLGQAYLVPYNNRKKGTVECQLIPGYKGLIKLAYQSGEVVSIRARVVREKDKFSYAYGLNERLEHEPHRGADAGALVAVYAVAKTKGDSEPQFLVMEKHEVDEVRDRSRASNDGPWVTDYPEMAKKTVLRRLCKLLPASVEKDNLAKALQLAEAEEAGMPQVFSEDVIDVTAEPVEEPKSKLDELAEKNAPKEAS